MLLKKARRLFNLWNSGIPKVKQKKMVWANQALTLFNQFLSPLLKIKPIKPANLYKIQFNSPVTKPFNLNTLKPSLIIKILEE